MTPGSQLRPAPTFTPPPPHPLTNQALSYTQRRRPGPQTSLGHKRLGSVELGKLPGDVGAVNLARVSEGTLLTGEPEQRGLQLADSVSDTRCWFINLGLKEVRTLVISGNNLKGSDSEPCHSPPPGGASNSTLRPGVVCDLLPSLSLSKSLCSQIPVLMQGRDAISPGVQGLTEPMNSAAGRPGSTTGLAASHSPLLLEMKRTRKSNGLELLSGRMKLNFGENWVTDAHSHENNEGPSARLLRTPENIHNTVLSKKRAREKQTKLRKLEMLIPAMEKALA